MEVVRKVVKEIPFNSVYSVVMEGSCLFSNTSAFFAVVSPQTPAKMSLKTSILDLR